MSLADTALKPWPGAFLYLYGLCDQERIVSPMGGVVELGISFAEHRRLCEDLYIAADDPLRDLIARAFAAITRARGEGRAAGEEERETERKRQRQAPGKVG